MTSTTSDRTNQRFRPSAVDVFVLVLAGVAIVAGGITAGSSGQATSVTLGVTLVVLFAMAEIFVVHFGVRRNTHTFSLVEVPMVVALAFAAPAVFLGAHLVGAALALVLHRHQRSTKLVFNLASFTLQDVVAIAIFRSIAHDDVTHHTTWGALGLACLVASVLGLVLVMVVMRLSGGEQPTPPEIVESAAFGVAFTGIATAVAIAMVVLWEVDGPAALLLVPAFIGIHFALRSHVAAQTERRHLDAIEGATHLLESARPVDELIGELLAQARATFGVERAMYVHIGDDLVVTSRTTAPDGSIITRREATQHWESLVELVPAGRHGAVLAPTRNRTIGRGAATTRPRNGMLAQVDVGGHVAGYLMVADRLSDVGGFDDDALLVLQLMARQLAVAIADETPPATDRFHLLEAELNHRVRRDTVTGLANDIGLRDRLVGELGNAGDQQLAVVVVHLRLLDGADDELDDDLVLVTSQRLRSCVRGRDTVARPTSDGFAVVASTPGGEHDALALAQRILWNLSTPMNVDGDQRHLDVGVGICLRGATTDPDTLVARATSASRWAEADPRRIIVANA